MLPAGVSCRVCGGGWLPEAAAVHVLHAATWPALAALAVIVAGGIVFRFARRAGALPSAAFAEAACPACLALAYLSEQRT